MAYTPGTRLTLSFTKFDTWQTLIRTAVTRHAFTPFTKSQVLLVDFDDPTDSFPPTAILKVYDPAYIDDRARKSITNIPAHPWFLDMETQASRRRAAVACGQIADDYDENNWITFDTLHWEEYFLRAAETRYQSELEAYKRLHDLQGKEVPRCFASGRILARNARSVVVRVLLLEFISGRTLKAAPTGSVSRSLARSVIESLDKLAKHGVISGDIRAENIILPAAEGRWHRPVVIIDFGHAKVRTGECDYEWDEAVKSCGDIDDAKRLLAELGARPADPQRPRFWPHAKNIDKWNAYAEKLQRWYEPTHDLNGRDDVEEGERVGWKLKDEVAAWLDARDMGLLQGADPPRPGSPDYRNYDIC